MSRRKKYNYKAIHLKADLQKELDKMRREYGFVSYTELLVYLKDRELGISARKNNCNSCERRF